MKTSLMYIKSISLLGLILVIASCASTTPLSEDQREVVTVENHSLSQAEAYTKSLLWVAETYNSANEVLQLQNKETGTLVVSALNTITRAGGLVSFSVSYNMTIDFNEEQVRFTQRIGSPQDPSIGGISSADAEKMHQHFESLRISLLDYLTKSDDF
ncbi:DUF4468 domain-containing protein [Gracilimonas sp. BCB1]|uniref:DUF4468 domain-containing protein n=1 Tax=Gracilimonas sp. BCB1 TaxID=3152362 RepID=UPI0032D92364